MSDDIIELGEDGSFDISTTPVKQQAVQHLDYEQFDWEKAAQETNSSVISSLTANEYAVYRDESKFVIILRLPEGTSMKEVVYTSSELTVRLQGQDGPVRIDLPDNVEIQENSLESKHFKDLVTIRFTSK